MLADMLAYHANEIWKFGDHTLYSEHSIDDFHIQVMNGEGFFKYLESLQGVHALVALLYEVLPLMKLVLKVHLSRNKKVSMLMNTIINTAVSETGWHDGHICSTECVVRHQKCWTISFVAVF